MIEFRQKEFTEYDAMRYLYNELMKNDAWRRKIQIIGTDSLIPVLKGNNVVIERFVISTRAFHKDKYRMYLKIGAKAKMPDAVRLPGQVRTNKLLNSSISISGGIFRQKNNSEIKLGQKEFKGNGNNNGPKPAISATINPVYADIQYETTVPKGETIDYDKKSRSIVLEFDNVGDAIGALNILPFGLNYKVYLLDV